MSQTITFGVEGMTCASCVARVERALRAVPGADDAAVNLVAKTARVAYSAPADPAALVAALAKAGYPATEDTARLDVDGMTCASCVGRVERALRAKPGVLKAEVNLATHSAHVRYTTGATSPSELAGAVTAAGYSAHPATDVAATGHQHDHNNDVADLRRRAVLSSILTLPVFILAMGGHAIPAVHHWITATIGLQTSWLIQLVLTAAVLVFPGRIFLQKGIPALLRGAPEMNSLVALGSLAAFSYSTVATFAPALLPAQSRDVYFEAAAVIVTLILAGRLLEARAKGQAGEAVRRLVGLRPDTARVERPGGPVTLPVADLLPGDIVHLAPGERVAVDGTVTEGHGWLDESMLTGEPAPVEKAAGSPVTGGTINGTAALSYRVTAVGNDTVLARIIRMVEDAQATKLPVQAMVDRVTLWFVPAVMTLAALTFILWLYLGPEPALTHALVAGISVLIIACPCAMGLATPVSILVGTGRGADLGILFRRGDALQRLAEANVVAFDKTGTLTEGTPRLTDFAAVAGVDKNALLARVAAAEARSEHPLARAVLAAASERGLALPAASDSRALPGRGLAAKVEGQTLYIGNAALLADLELEPAALADQANALSAEGKTPVYVAEGDRVVALTAMADTLRPTSAAAIADLHSMGMTTVMISGDTPATANAIGKQLGIGEVRASVLPEGKVAALEELKGRGIVAFVGDGINDAPALAAADVGIAIGGGTDVAIEAAEVVLMTGDPGVVGDAIHLSRAVMRNIRQNLFWAFGYNVLLIPVAAGALYPINGMLLSPMLAAGAMALSSVFVVTNALRLRRAGPWRAKAEGTAPRPA
jgi:Cu+-exporting ATPase